MEIVNKFKGIFSREDEVQDKSYLRKDKKSDNQIYKINEKNKIIVALTASIMAAKDEKKSKFHILKIIRVE